MTLQTALEFNVRSDKSIGALIIEYEDPSNPAAGDFGKDAQFRKKLLEYLMDTPTDLLQLIVNVGSTQRIYSEAILSKIQRHAKILHDILDYSRSIEGRNPLEADLQRKIKDLIFSNIFQFYLEILFSRKKTHTNTVEKIYSLLIQDPFIKEFYQYHKQGQNRPLVHYYTILAPHQVYGLETSEVVVGEKALREIDNYHVGFFSVVIADSVQHSLEKKYTASLRESTLYSKIRGKVAPKIDEVPLPVTRQMSFKDLENNLETVVSGYIQRDYSYLSSIDQQAVAKTITYERLGFFKLLPLLLDENINEIFSDGPGCELYIDHSKWGRCRTNLSLSVSEFETITSRLKLESMAVLDYLNPSLKTDFNSTDFRTRINIDIPPLAVRGPYLDVRKFYYTPLTIFDLLKNQTLTCSAAAFLLFCIQNRLNIATIGSPGSGKTTLINALDLMTPSNWRKVAIEDTIEGVNQTTIGNHHIQLQVGSGLWKNTTKTTEIIKLLHRTPDYLFLGEIQTKEHSQALFHALNAGLKGIQTCHADSPEGMLLRWVYNHKISVVSLCALDILIQMRHKIDNSKRQVVRIAEIDPTEINKVIQKQKPVTALVHDLFVTPSEDKALTPKTLSESKVLSRLCTQKGITHQDIQATLSIYTEMFEHKIHSNDSLATQRIEFDKLYRSYVSKEQILGTPSPGFEEASL